MMSAGRLFVEVTGAAAPAPGCVGLSISATTLLHAAKKKKKCPAGFHVPSKYGFICTRNQIFTILNKKRSERKKEIAYCALRKPLFSFEDNKIFFLELKVNFFAMQMAESV